MRKFFLSIIIFSFSVSAQSIDSLQSEIEDLHPEEQLEILSVETWKYRSKDPIYALHCGNLGLSVAKQLDNKRKLAELNNFLGVVQRNMGNYAHALNYYSTALQIAEEAGDSLQMAYSYNNIGGAYRLENNFNLALENMYKALDIFTELDDKRGIAFCTINIGIVFRNQKNFDRAMDYFQRTVNIREDLGDKFGKALALNQIVEIYYDQNMLEKAQEKYEELLELYKELNDTKGIATVKGGIGGINYMQGNFAEAEKYRESALEMHRDIKNLEGISNSLQELALIYEQLGKSSQAEEALNDAYNIAAESNQITMLIDYYKTQSEFYRLRNDFKEALKSFQMHSSLKDSLNRRINIESIASMEALHRVNLANKENEILLHENQLQYRQNLFLLILAILLILFISFGIYKYFQKRVLTSKLQELNRTKDKFFSIIAHDLKNPFNNLLGYSEMLTQDFESMTDEEKRTALQDFNRSSKKLLLLVENLLDWARTNTGSLKFNPEKINLAEEIENAIGLYKTTIQTKRLFLNVDVPGTMSVYTDRNYLNLVLRNLINNAVKFSHENGKIQIQAESINSHHQVSIIDEGVGIEDDKLNSLFEIGSTDSTRGTHAEQGSGLGLLLVNELVKKWGGEVKVESESGKGSKFSITIPKVSTE